jgi:hypothetical protein
MIDLRWRTDVRRTFVAPLAVLSLVALVGCASTALTQVKQFGLASSSLGEDTRRAFDLAATASVDRHLYDVASDTAKGPTDATFQGLFTGDSGVADGKAKAERLAFRLRVLDQLSNYSSALQKLAEADFGKDIDAAGLDLYGSLIGLRDTFKKATGSDLPITDADIGIITTAVNAIGKAVVGASRRAAIKTTIAKADPAVQKATALIASDLGQNSDLASFVKEAISNSRGSVQQAYNRERSLPSSTFDTRYALLLRARQLYDAEANTPAFFAAVSKGTSAVGRAHSALRRAVEADDFSSAEVSKRIGELEVYVKSVRGFYKSIEEIEK